MKSTLGNAQPDELLSALAARGIAHCAHIEDDVRALVDTTVVEHHLRAANALSIFVAPASLPQDRVRHDRPTRSFIASGPWIGSLPATECEETSLCFRALHRALSGDAEVPDITVHNGVAAVERDLGRPGVEFIIPHKGSFAHLDVCLSGVRSQSMECIASVCLDEPADAWPVHTHRRIRHYRAEDPPVGPYAIRQFLAMNSSAEYLAFQDSDDFSVRSRLAELLTACVDSGADIVGCHELRLDEIEQAVIPVRFPLDVNAALKEVAGHPQLFPTTVTRAATFKRIGGLSTIRTFGGDTEYLLRAHFLARIINIDRFLYIRRRREGSLTTAPDTALGSPVRVELGRIWRKDFEDVKNGQLALEQSSLALRHGAPVRIVATELNANNGRSAHADAAQSQPLATDECTGMAR